jgi:hypothetical protein
VHTHNLHQFLGVDNRLAANQIRSTPLTEIVDKKTQGSKEMNKPNPANQKSSVKEKEPTHLFDTHLSSCVAS